MEGAFFSFSLCNNFPPLMYSPHKKLNPHVNRPRNTIMQAILCAKVGIWTQLGCWSNVQVGNAVPKRDFTCDQILRTKLGPVIGIRVTSSSLIHSSIFCARFGQRRQLIFLGTKCVPGRSASKIHSNIWAISRNRRK